MSTYQELAPPLILVLMEDDPLHTADNPFCYDGTCGCHEDPLLIAEVAQFVDDGLLTPDEASDFVAGRSLSWLEGEKGR